MPFRSFVCQSCGAVTEDLQDLHDETLIPCFHCGDPTKRSFRHEANRKHSTGQFAVPITMYSVGLNPDEIAQFRKDMPDVKLDLGCPVAHNRPEKMRILKHFGFQENN